MPATSPPVPPPDSAGDDLLRGKRMAMSLGRLLDRVRGARDVLPHLAALERGLLDRGVGVIARVPPQGLAKICSQLSSLPLPQEDPPLHELLTRLMDALERRPRPPRGAAAAPPASTAAAAPAPRAQGPQRDDHPFDMERTVVIEETTHSDFMRVAGGQDGTRRGGV